MKKTLRWLAALLWMAVVMGLSTDAFGAEHTGALLLPSLQWLLPWASPSQLALVHASIRKLAHVTEYAVLATLWFRALVVTRREHLRRACLVAFVICVLWATLDEAHQATTRTRGASPADVVLDASGAGGALVVLARRRHGRPRGGSDLQPGIEGIA